MSIERQLRGKRSTFTINVMQTPHGFSLVQGTELLNKIEGQPNIVQQLQSNTTNSNQQNYSVPSKDYKPVYKKTNLLFLRNKQTSIANVQSTNNQQITTPAYCKVFAPWFDLNNLHNIEKKEVIQWFCQKFKVTVEEAEQKEEVEEWLKFYQKHRNFIVKLYIQQFAQSQKYLSANTIRKYLSHDAFWVMKLHQFLSSLGVINTHNPNFAFQSKTYTHILKTRKDGKKQLLPHQLQTNIHNETDQNDQSQLLKKITAKIRPYCDFCRIHCGIVWFQHNRSMDPKEIANIMKNVNSKNPPLSQKEYEYVLCVKCYCQGHFPLLLTHHDFKKISINDKLDPGRKKKTKRRRKEKKIRQGEDMEEQAKQIQQERSHVEEEDQGKKKEQINAMISKLVNGIQQYQWSLQQINLLLELIEKHGEDWITIHEQLKKKGFAKNQQTEEIIMYFLSLPRRSIGKLKEQYQDDQFIESNLSANKINVGDRLAQLKLNNAIQFTQKCSPAYLAQITYIASKSDYIWKRQLQEVIRLQKKKIENRLNYLFQSQNLVKLIKLQEKGI